MTWQITGQVRHWLAASSRLSDVMKCRVSPAGKAKRTSSQKTQQAVQSPVSNPLRKKGWGFSMSPVLM